MIRDATRADIPAMAFMGRLFWYASPWASLGEYDGDGVKRTLEGFFEPPNDVGLFVIEQDGDVCGMLGLQCVGAWMSDFNYAQEMFWWVEPRASGESVALLRRGEEWAAERNAVMSMMRLDGMRDAALDRLYRMRGYRPIEHTYLRIG